MTLVSPILPASHEADKVSSVGPGRWDEGLGVALAMTP
jgi:hypothetical protein